MRVNEIKVFILDDNKHIMTLSKGRKLAIVNNDGSLESGGQRLFEILELSSVDYETQTQLVRLKVIE